MGADEVAQQVSALAVRLFTNNIARSYSSEFQQSWDKVSEPDP